jgi:primosomal protein N' (replication factor Y)
MEYCDIALRVPARQWFTYSIPAALQSCVKPGMRALAPLRHDAVIGIVGRVHGDKPQMNVRDILDIVDDRPWLTGELLRLGGWVSDYYFCSPGEALFAMIPGGLRATTDTVYSHEPQRVPTGGLKPSERRLCLYLAEHPSTTRTELLKVFPQAGTASRLEQLAAMGTISMARRVRAPKSSGLTERVISWTGPEPADHSDALAAYLSAARAPVRARELKAEFPDSPRRLLKLARKNWVRAFEAPAAYEPHLPEYTSEPALVLTAAQADSVKQITASFGRHETFLLYGVTGSGKTEVYIQCIRTALEGGGSVLYLAPEIGLANHLLAYLAPHFRNRVVLLHSGLTERERARAWQAVHGGERTLVVGTRSAVWAPLRNLALVVVDEEQDSSFKQDDPAPRYNGRDVAIWRARHNGAVCVLGSATPSLESWENARTGKYRLLQLPERVGARKLPGIVLVDRRQEYPQIAGGSVTQTVAEGVRAALDQGGQAILFLNRRGFSGALRCSECGHMVACPDCSVAFSFHKDLCQLRCHFCGRAEPAPDVCPSCKSVEFRYPRAGTQKVEAELALLFPGKRIVRLDLDVAAQRGGSASVLEAFGRRDADILLGTQMVTKGLHFPHVAVVGILNADLSLDLPDFRADERTLQLVLQVAGRAGRGDTPGTVYLQTYQPDHRVYAYAAAADYSGFADAAITERRLLSYPPAARVIRIVAGGADEAVTEKSIGDLAQSLRRASGAPYKLMGPSPAPLRRLRKNFRWQLVLKTSRVKQTLSLVGDAIGGSSSRGVRFNVDVDPLNML